MRGALNSTTSFFLSWPAAAWCRWHERRILSQGRPLTPIEHADALSVGVQNPSCIRILEVPMIPNPLRAPLALVERRTGRCISTASGLSLRYGIFVTSGPTLTRALLVHEFVHTAQYERMGSLRRFISQYLSECLSTGYLEAPLEREARTKAASVCP
jgi:hypothetical protein